MTKLFLGFLIQKCEVYIYDNTDTGRTGNRSDIHDAIESFETDRITFNAWPCKICNNVCYDISFLLIVGVPIFRTVTYYDHTTKIKNMYHIFTHAFFFRRNTFSLSRIGQLTKVLVNALVNTQQRARVVNDTEILLNG